MHELSIALGILDVATEEAEKHNSARVLQIRLKLGPLAGVVREALLSAYDLARANTPLAEAELVIEDMPVLVDCSTCRSTQRVVSLQELCCVICGTPATGLVGGRELEVVALEIE